MSRTVAVNFPGSAGRHAIPTRLQVDGVWIDLNDTFDVAAHPPERLPKFSCQEPSRAVSISERLDVGMLCVNRGLMSDPAAPFGGLKSSGLGRAGGQHALEDFVETKISLSLRIETAGTPVQQRLS